MHKSIKYNITEKANKKQNVEINPEGNQEFTRYLVIYKSKEQDQANSRTGAGRAENILKKKLGDSVLPMDRNKR